MCCSRPFSRTVAFLWWMIDHKEMLRCDEFQAIYGNTVWFLKPTNKEVEVPSLTLRANGRFSDELDYFLQFFSIKLCIFLHFLLH